MTKEQKHAYLISWHWSFTMHELGFNIYSHNRFPNVKYKLDRAYEVMKANEPSSEPILIARLDNPEEMNNVKDFIQNIIGVKSEKEKMEDLIKSLHGS